MKQEKWDLLNKAIDEDLKDTDGYFSGLVNKKYLTR